MTIENFRRLARITLILLFVVIFAGGFVRMTGSGMGCPDWPKCFGKIIPPTSIEELPNDYKNVYLEKRKIKLERFINLLQKIGFDDTANKLKNEEKILASEDFNPQKTWTEYINRLSGAITGIFVVFTFIASFLYKEKKRVVQILCGLQLFVIIFQGWLGAIVVATNITPWVLTIHMLLALLLISIQLLIIFLTQYKTINTQLISFTGVRWFLLLGLVLLIIQIIFGTQVRQELDILLVQLYNISRLEIMHQLIQNGGWIIIHRSFSILILAIYVFVFIKNLTLRPGFEKINYLFVIILIEIIIGIILTYVGLPRFAQLLHLLISCFLYGIAFYSWLEVNHSRLLTKKEN